MIPPNPYDHVGRVADGDHFVPRPQLAERIERTWQRDGEVPGNLSILGHHRTGKTSLVKHAAARCGRTDLRTVYVDVGTKSSARDVFRAVVRDLYTADGSPSAQSAVVGVCVGASDWDELSDAVNAYLQARAADRRFAVVVLDEFDRASEKWHSISEFQLLRSLASEPYYGIGLITVSRQRIMTIEKGAAGGSVLDGVVTLREFIGAFTPDEAMVLLHRADTVGADLTAVCQDLFDLAGRHPYLLEHLCHSVIRHFHGTGETDVATAYEYVMDTFHDYFKHLMDGVAKDLGTSGMEVLDALAKGNPLAAGTRRVLNQFRLTGLVDATRGNPELFSNEFGRYLTTL